MRVTEMVRVSVCDFCAFLGICESFFFFPQSLSKGLSLTNKDFHSKSLAQAQTRQISSLIGLNNSEGYLVFANDCSIL